MSIVNPNTFPQASFWHHRTVLVTGHTGFKGSWLTLWLQQLGAQVIGAALASPTTPNLFQLAQLAQEIDHHHLDIRDPVALATLIKTTQPEIIFHLAAQPLVKASYQQPLQTWQTNALGTVHVLDAVRTLAADKAPRVVLIITTDKVYQDQGWVYPYRETDPLGGYDPYSASKAAAELITASYRQAFLAEQGIAVATARAGNVMGGGDWATDRLIPDAVRAWGAHQALQIRSPTAVRPWQHVLEPLAGYMRLAEHLWQQPEHAGAYNFGPSPDQAVPVATIIAWARQYYGSAAETPIHCVADTQCHETAYLALDTAYTKAQLGLVPRWSLKYTLERTMAWYRHYEYGEDAKTLCLSDIAAYCLDATSETATNV
jgi:CDP-glucose 4,6-dehydratase